MRRASLFISFLAVLTVTAIPSRSAESALPSTVFISEVAWMGTTTSVNDEWLELQNPTSIAVTLDGWALAATDGTPSITLSGTIAAGGFFLLERTDDTTVPSIATDQPPYTGALDNNGELLTLRDANGVLFDSVDASSGWPAGDNTTKQTMERQADGTWMTSTSPGGTPRAANSAGDSPPSPPPQTPPDPPPPLSDPPSTTAPPPLENQSANPPVTESSATTLRLSELLPDPEGKDGEGEFVEIHNYGSESVVLDDWKIQDASGKSLALSGTIAPGTYVAFRAADTSLPTLNNDGDTIVLHDPAGNLRDGVSFSGTVEGLALIRVGEGWQWTSTPTPNAPNVLATPQGGGTPAPAVVLAAPPTPDAVVDDDENGPHSSAGAVDITAPRTRDGNELAAALRTTGEKEPLSPLVPAAATAILAFFAVLGARILAKRRAAPSFIIDDEGEKHRRPPTGIVE